MPIAISDAAHLQGGTIKILATFAATILLCFVHQSQALSANLPETIYFPIALPVASHGNPHVAQFGDYGISGSLRKKDEEEDDEGDCDEELPAALS